MTQDQRQAVIDAQNAFFSAQDKADAEDQNVLRTNQAEADAQNYVDRVLPVKQQNERQAAIQDLIAKQAANSAQFQATNDAHRALDDADRALANAQRASRQTGAVEHTGPVG